MAIAVRTHSATRATTLSADPSRNVYNNIRAALRHTPLALNGMFGNEGDGPLTPAFLPKGKNFNDSLKKSQFKITGGATRNSTSVNEFFRDLKEDASPAERKAISQIQAAMSQLKNTRVMISSSEKIIPHLFVMGQAKDGDWVGLHTTLVWT